MRTFVILSGLALVALIVGFLPQPLVRLNWKTPYDLAIAEGNCAAASHILELLNSTGFWQEASEADFQNKKLNRCDAGLVPEHNIGRESIFYTDSDGYVSRGYFDERWRSSVLGSRFYFWRGRTKLQMSSIVSAADRDARETLRQCIDQVGSVSGALPNYRLLIYALKSSELSSERISEISREQKAQCLRQLLVALKVMKVAAKTPEDRAAITLYSFPVYSFKGEAPDQAWLEASIFGDLTLDDYQLASPGTRWSDAEIISGYNCRGDRLADQLLIYSILCAEESRLFADAGQPDATLFAAYYARRAKRFGWQDVQLAEDAARAQLTEQCFSAIIEMEAQDAGANTDPRDFERPSWPTKPGEVCFDDVNPETEEE